MLLFRCNIWRTTATSSASPQSGRWSSRICLCPVKLLLHSINLVMLKLLQRIGYIEGPKHVWTCKSTSAKSTQSRTELTPFASFDFEQIGSIGSV